MPSDLIAVVPAAGRGTRLGVDTPKLFTSITESLRVWDVLISQLASSVSRIHVVLSDEGLAYFEQHRPLVPTGVELSLSVQPVPRGMGDAVFGAIEHWRDARDVIVVWGDQVGLSRETLSRTVETQRSAPPPSITLPLVAMSHPYVHYAFVNERLDRVQQAREGDTCPPSGRSDVGLFAFSSVGIEAAWQRYLTRPESRGARTREINLLPFFAHLSTHDHFAVNVIEVHDANESRGINTPDDLAHFRERLNATR